MFNSAVRFLLRRRLRLMVQHACTALILFLATNAKATVSTFSQTGHESQSQASSFVSKAAFLNNSSSRNGTKSPPADDDAGGMQSPATPAGKRIADWNGIKRDTGIIAGGQVAAVAITYVMPQSFSAWTPEQKKAGLAKYKKNFVNPVMDKDAFYVNYILHPYWGATYYTRARERGLDKEYAVAYSALLSAMYEFGVECIAERPSIQDLVVTPLVGSLLGALIEPWRDSIKRKEELAWYDHTALVATDPLGVISAGFEKMFGIKSTILVDYSPPQMRNRPPGSALASNNSRIGVTLQIPFN